MANITAAELEKVNSFPRLIELLETKLDWPINGYDLEDLTYEYEPKELGLKPEETAQIREIHQLRPLATNQPWGIFFISFEDKTISVTVLRRILRNLIVKKRAGVQAAERQAWDRNDLIFAANFGKSGERELAFVHFSDGAATGDLPVMKVLGWNAKDAKLHNDHVGRTLAEKLRWPDDPANHAAWRAQWASAFELRLNETIKTSKELAIRLAVLATDIRARANQLLAAETEAGPMQTMLAAFRKTLIQDLDADGFADMFAQTICYGLLAASISKLSTDPDIMASGMAQPTLVADNIADMVPRTNPFLKELFGNFLKLGGRDRRSGFDFDELGVRDVVDMLNAANMPAVLRDFGDRNPKEDPVIHFYELFLKEYDPKKRMQRGVFYTPRPVVNFIVRGVDEILREEFGLPLGLADTTTWGEMAARNDSITVPDRVDPAQPFVQILDPATGTGTFLVEVIDLIHTRMVEHWKGEGKRGAQIADAWNAYVPAYLLPRLTAFELMMAPYAIAHMKVGLKLVETGYRFGSDERARIFLTNALEPARDLDMEFIFMSEALAHEAGAANDAKAKTPFTVVIGNPPYAGISKNMFPWIDGLLKGREPESHLRKSYYEIEGVPLGEKKIWLQDDYVKFIRLAQYFLDRSSKGILGFISNNGYLDNPTFRGMRWQLMQSFGQISILDLHGSVKKRETAENGGVDQNVFDIEQGVAIGLFVNGLHHSTTRLEHFYGTREAKSDSLLKRGWQSESETDLKPIAPFFFFQDRDDTNGDEYRALSTISDVCAVNVSGIVTARDQLTVHFNDIEASSAIEDFCSPSMTDSHAKSRWGLSDNYSWKVADVRRQCEGKAASFRRIEDIGYRPFDQRKIVYDPRVVFRTRDSVMRHMIGGENVAISTVRQLATDPWEHILACENLQDDCYISNRTKERGYLFPLWLNPSIGEAHRRPNIDRKFAQGLGAAVGLTYEDGIARGKQESLGTEFRHEPPEQLSLDTALWDGRGDLHTSFGPRDLFDWIYAVLHAPSYRARYAEFLKSDFPRIPTPASLKLLQALAPLGRDLVALHLLRPEEAPALNDPAKFHPAITFNGSGEPRVEKGYPKYENGKVMINASRWFEDVPKETWGFHVGGYQVCEKWLKDRAAKGGKKASTGRVLMDEDILHYRRVVVALTETRRLMAEIDKLIDTHGGWPGAFQTGGANGKT